MLLLISGSSAILFFFISMALFIRAELRHGTATARLHHLCSHLIPNKHVHRPSLWQRVTAFLWQSKSKARFLMALPSSIRLIANHIRAGRSLPDALERAGRAGTGPVYLFWAHVGREVQVGEPFSTALYRSAHRLSIREVYWLETLLVVLYATGGDLPGALDDAANVMEAEAQARREFRSLTSDVRTIAVLLPGMAILLLFTLLLLMPSLLAILLQPLGLFLLGAFALVQLAIYGLIQRMARVRI